MAILGTGVRGISGGIRRSLRRSTLRTFRWDGQAAKSSQFARDLKHSARG